MGGEEEQQDFNKENNNVNLGASNEDKTPSYKS